DPYLATHLISPSPRVSSTTSPSRAVNHIRSLVGTSLQACSFSGLHFTAPSKAVTFFDEGPPVARVRRSATALRGWQYCRFVPSFGLALATTAYPGFTFAMNCSVVELSL